ncbi:hypothetical protein ABZ801_39165 [Actinomadura sp. NPDC047616]|uniref:hypothetical protein n=1 Tax=Actinomadura sp. NPDC047616 TaxID=3155914 RepID=UPI00340CA43B
MNERSRAMPENDIISLRLRQHAEIGRLFAELEASTGRQRTAVFHRLRRLLTALETVEEDLLHPVAGHDGEQVEASLPVGIQATPILPGVSGLEFDDSRHGQRPVQLGAGIFDLSARKKEGKCSEVAPAASNSPGELMHQ